MALSNVVNESENQTSVIDLTQLTCHPHFQDGYEDVYDPEVDPTISMVFSTASYRLHTLIPGYYSLRDANYKETNRMQLRDNFRHGCQMAIARLLDCMCLALRASGLWLRCKT